MARGGFRPGRGGGMGGMDPRAMARAMKQMGISTEDVEGVEEVVIRTREKDIVIRPADVSVMIAQGQRTWTVNGEATERPRGSVADVSGGGPATGPTTPPFTEGDVQLVMEQAGVDRTTAVRALEASDGEPAAAIVSLLEEKG